MKLLKSHRISRSIGGNLTVLFFLVLMGAFTALPLLYAVLNAFKPLNELFIYPPRFFVQHPTWENFWGLFKLQENMLVPASFF